VFRSSNDFTNPFPAVPIPRPCPDGRQSSVSSATPPRPVRLALALTIVLVLAPAAAGGCGSSPEVVEARPGPRTQTAGPTSAAPGDAGGGELTRLDPGLGLLLGVPVYGGDFADPFLLRVGDRNFAYATNTADANVPLIESGDGPVGRYRGDVLPTLPAWSGPGRVWAPSVVPVGDAYVLHYTTTVRSTGRQCISAAVAPTPRGPFVDASTGPMVCQEDLGGSIDPSVVTDADGVDWLLFKNDGNCCGSPTAIWSQRLAPDHLSVVGPPHRLLTARDDTWEGGLIEGPSMVVAGDDHWLFYSANAWDSERYAIGVARCRSVTGPCDRTTADEPWMGSTAFARGPGGQEFFAALDEVWMVYHGWARGEAGAPGAQRRLYLDIVEVTTDGPRRVGGRRAGVVVALAAAATAVAVAGTVLVLRRRRSRRDRAGSGQSPSGTPWTTPPPTAPPPTTPPGRSA
jgi:hypothetical protein